MSNISVVDGKLRSIGDADYDTDQYDSYEELARDLRRRFFINYAGQPPENWDLPITARIHVRGNFYRDVTLYA